MVGQDLGTLAACADWTKVMTYGHALGPAGGNNQKLWIDTTMKAAYPWGE
jgi:hypothetical protein